MRLSVLKNAIALAVFLFVCISRVSWAADATAEEDSVLVVTSDTIEQAIKDHSHLVVEFYAPWCGHCKKLAPILSEAATKMKEVDKDIVFAKMDATADVNKDFKEKMGIKSFPTFRLFQGTVDSAKEYRPPRTTPELVQYFKAIKDGKKPPEPAPAPKRKAEPLVEPEGSAVTVLTLDNFDAFIKENEFVVVEFYAPWCGHCKRLFPEFTKASMELIKHDPSIKLAKIDLNEDAHKPIGKRYGVRGYPTLKIFQNGSPVDYGGPRDSAGIVKYLSTLRTGSPDVEDDDDDEEDDDDDVATLHEEL